MITAFRDPRKSTRFLFARVISQSYHSRSVAALLARNSSPRKSRRRDDGDTRWGGNVPADPSLQRFNQDGQTERDSMLRGRRRVGFRRMDRCHPRLYLYAAYVRPRPAGAFVQARKTCDKSAQSVTPVAVTSALP